MFGIFKFISDWFRVAKKQKRKLTCRIHVCLRSGRGRKGFACIRQCPERRLHRWIPGRKCIDKSRLAIGIVHHSCTDGGRSGRRPRTWRRGIPMDRHTCSCRACEGGRFRRAGKEKRRTRSVPGSHRGTPRSQVGTNTRSSAPRLSTSSQCTCRHFGIVVQVQWRKDWGIDSTRPHTEVDN